MRRLTSFAVAVALTATASVASAKISGKQKLELAGYVTQLAESTDPEVKHALLLTRGAVADKKQLKELLALEANEDAQVRLGAKLAAVVSGDKKAHARVAAELIKQGVDYGTIRNHLAPLRDVDELKIIAAVLKDAKAERVSPVYRYLAQSHGELFKELVDALSSSKAETRSLAARAFIEAGRLDVMPSLNKLLKSKDEAVRTEAIQMIVAFSREPDAVTDAQKLLATALKDASTKNRELAARRLVELKNAAGAPVLLELAKAAPKPEAVASILGFLLDNGVYPGAAAVAGWLTSENANVKVRAYQLTAASKDKAFVSKLVEMYGSTEFDDRILAVRSIGYSGDKRAATVLTSSLFEARTDIRAAAAEGLAVLGSAATLGALKTALTKERDKNIKLTVIDAIGAVGGEAGLQLLRFQVTNSDVEVKLRTVEAIRRIGVKKGAKALEVLLRDRNVDVQWRAFLAALVLDAAVAKPLFKTTFRNPPAGFLADVMTLPTAQRKQVLKHLLNETTGTARDKAVKLVMKNRSLGGDKVLYEIALSSTADSRLRKELIRFFGDRATKKDITVLETLARGKDPTLARLAAWMLTRHPAKGLEASYRGYLASKDEALRAIAAYGLSTVWR